MTVGLPGTGIGGIFYLLLAVYMPVREFVRTLKGKTNLKRWCFITGQLFFVSGIVSAMWSEVWLLNRLIICVWGVMKINGPLPAVTSAFNQTKIMAITSAAASFASLAFVIITVHILRFFVHRSSRRQSLSAAESRCAFKVLKPSFSRSQPSIIASSPVPKDISSIKYKASSIAY